MPIDSKYLYISEMLSKGMSLDCTDCDIAPQYWKQDVFMMMEKSENPVQLIFPFDEHYTQETLSEIKGLASTKNVTVFFKKIISEQ